MDYGDALLDVKIPVDGLISEVAQIWRNIGLPSSTASERVKEIRAHFEASAQPILAAERAVADKAQADLNKARDEAMVVASEVGEELRDNDQLAVFTRIKEMAKEKNRLEPFRARRDEELVELKDKIARECDWMGVDVTQYAVADDQQGANGCKMARQRLGRLEALQDGRVAEVSKTRARLKQIADKIGSSLEFRVAHDGELAGSDDGVVVLERTADNRTFVKDVKEFEDASGREVITSGRFYAHLERLEEEYLEYQSPGGGVQRKAAKEKEKAREKERAREKELAAQSRSRSRSRSRSGSRKGSPEPAGRNDRRGDRESDRAPKRGGRDNRSPPRRQGGDAPRKVALTARDSKRRDSRSRSPVRDDSRSRQAPARRRGEESSGARRRDDLDERDDRRDRFAKARREDDDDRGRGVKASDRSGRDEEALPRRRVAGGGREPERERSSPRREPEAQPPRRRRKAAQDEEDREVEVDDRDIGGDRRQRRRSAVDDDNAAEEPVLRRRAQPERERDDGKGSDNADESPPPTRCAQRDPYEVDESPEAEVREEAPAEGEGRRRRRRTAPEEDAQAEAPLPRRRAGRGDDDGSRPPRGRDRGQRYD